MSDTPYLESLVRAAFLRSLGRFHNGSPALHLKQDGNTLEILCGSAAPQSSSDIPSGKRIIFGPLRQDKARAIGLRPISAPLQLDGQDACPSCSSAEHHTESPAYIQYTAHSLLQELASALYHRPFTRFDFADEWNNMGFGRIRTDDTPWGVKGGITTDGAIELAGMYVRHASGQPVYAGSYLTLLDTPTASILWCARPVGPLDSTEWSIIERFISDWRSEDLPCLPCLRQTPAGCRCLVTMRLDCDEDISSARDVFEWYTDSGIPFSLAVKTGLPMRPADIAMLEDVRAAGGTLLSHSHTHPYNWGASAEEALAEATASRQWFQSTWPHQPAPCLAVSPFHSNPPYAVRALEQSGFTGLASGIIHNDPEYLLGRAGVAPLTDGTLVSISQQSMLHGDCYRQQANCVDVHVQAFEAQYAAHGIFGYLDHPFSERYQYGWESKAQRLDAHQQLITALRSRSDVWFWNQEQCFNFVRACSCLHLHVNDAGMVTAEGLSPDMPYRPVYRLRGEEYTL